MDDYYELLGVDDDAPVDDIRSAYREKKAALDTSGTDTAKADAAALNKAWNVLSDPYQRGRYDQLRIDDGEVDDDADGDSDGDAAPVSRRPARQPRPAAADRAERRRNARQPLKPTVSLPAGVSFPSTRRRLTAMGIDLFVLFVLFIGSQLLVVSQEKAHHATVYHEVTKVLPDKITKAQDVVSKANKTASSADSAYTAAVKKSGAKSTAAQDAKDAKTKADDAQTKAKAAEKKLETDLTKQQDILRPTSTFITGMFFMLALLVLLVPSVVFGGQTLGKRFQGLRVARLDGSRAGFGELFRRYGLIVFASYALFSLAGPIGGAAVLFVVTMWSRNPNQQGLQDRFAKTLVVADDEQ